MAETVDNDWVVSDVSEQGVLTLTLNRPERLNALSGTMSRLVSDRLQQAERDRAVRVVVLTGAGRAFCAGADLKAEDSKVTAGAAIDSGLVPTFLEAQEHVASLVEQIHRLRKPVVAAVNGLALGGGFSIALACDVRIVSNVAKLVPVGNGLGITPCDVGTSYFLPRLVGGSRAAEILLTRREIPADEAASLGLAAAAVEPEGLLQRAHETAALIAAASPLTAWMTKETLWQSLDAPSLRAALDLEARTQVMCAAASATH